MNYAHRDNEPLCDSDGHLRQQKRLLNGARRAHCHSPAFEPSTKQAYWQLATTVAALSCVFGLMTLASVTHLPVFARVVLLLGTAVLLGLVVFRFFVIEHDCAHGSFFPSMVANRRLGIAISLLTLTPFHAFAENHLLHHRQSGKRHIDSGSINQTVSMTLQQYLSRSLAQRIQYRVQRDPFLFFLLGPIFNLLQGVLLKRGSWLMLLCASITGGALYYFTAPLLMWIWLAGLYLYNALTVFGVHIQHTFNPGYCKTKPEWRFEDAAFAGSSYHTTFGLGWFFCGVEHHSLHHFAARVPGYRLKQCFEMGRATLWPSVHKTSALELLALTKLALFDEENEKFLSFSELAQKRSF